MKTNFNIENKMIMKNQMTNRSRFQVLEYDKLMGARDIETAWKIHAMNESGLRLRQIRILLDESEVQIEAGLMNFLKGNIEINNKMGGVLGLGKKFISSKLTGEAVFKPTYYGDGEIFLEAGFKNYALVELEDEGIIVQDGMFVACEDGISVGAKGQKRITSIILGEEELFQVGIKGEGIVVLDIPVPEEEIFKCVIDDDVLKVDNSVAILRTDGIEYTVEKSTHSIVGSATSGEGFLNVYRGTGEVWLVPTKKFYNIIKNTDLNENMKK